MDSPNVPIQHMWIARTYPTWRIYDWPEREQVALPLGAISRPFGVAIVTRHDAVHAQNPGISKPLELPYPVPRLCVGIESAGRCMSDHIEFKHLRDVICREWNP